MLTNFALRTLVLGAHKNNWTPKYLTGIDAWLRGDFGTFQDAAGTTPAVSGDDPVGLWKDQSGWGRDFSQSTAGFRPLLKLGANGIGNKPGLLLDGVDDYLARAENYSMAYAGWVAIVYTLTAPENANEVIYSSYDEASTTHLWSLKTLYNNTTKPVSGLAENNAGTLNDMRSSTTYNQTTGAPYLVIWMSNGLAYTISNMGVIDTLVAESGVNDGAWLGDATARDNFLIGARKSSAGVGIYHKGLIAEIIQCSVPPIASEIAQLYAYISHRYGMGLPSRQTIADQAQLSQRIDGGSFSVLVPINPTSTSAAILTPASTFNSQWWWFSAMATRLSSLTVYKASCFQAIGGVYRTACWATDLDTDTWHDFGTIDDQASYVTLTDTLPSPVFIGNAPMYPFSRTARKMVEWATSPYVGQTPSTTNFILGTSTSRTGFDGRPIPSLPFYGFKISNPASVNVHNKMILTSGNHPGETPGRFTLEGAIEFLLSADAQAIALRDWFDVFIYPCLNPSGVYGGYYRNNPQDTTVDHNRQWLTPSAFEDNTAFMAAMHADAPIIQAGMDFHSNASRAENRSFVGDHTALEHPAFLTAIKVLDATFALEDDANVNTTIVYWLANYNSGDMKLCMSHETNGLLTSNVAEYKTLGANVMRAVYALLAAGKFPHHP